jgi:hypothetical protein
MSFGPPMPAPAFGGGFNALCTVQVASASSDALGVGVVAYTTLVANHPCSLQPMSTREAVRLGRSESGERMHNLYLASVDAAGNAVPVPTHTRFVIDGVTYETLGLGLVQGGRDGAVMMVPVREVER